jgi:hypothetical protein
VVPLRRADARRLQALRDSRGEQILARPPEFGKCTNVHELLLAVPTTPGHAEAQATKSCSACGLVDEEVDRDADELFTGAALVDARHLLRVRSAKELRRRKTRKAPRVVQFHEFKAGLPPPSHISEDMGPRPLGDAA